MKVSTNETAGDAHASAEVSPVAADAPAAAYRVLFFSATEPDVASGTPVIVCDMLAHFPPADAELVCERKYHVSNRRKISLRHRVCTVRFPNCLWPFRRGSRVREWLVCVGLPWLVLVGCWRVWRLRPTCLVAIYFRTPWIIAVSLISRITGVPLVFYVHDTFRENFDHGDGLATRFAAWLESKALRRAHVMVLHPYLADHYRDRYGIECTILRQVISREPRPQQDRDCRSEPLTIGFAGAIYDNNSRQLAELAEIVSANPRLRLKIWTDASAARLAELGIVGDRVENAFESNYERLLDHQSGCDLLYLPLAFADAGSFTTNALQYAFPTKSLDYLLAGPPILVHCPSYFELSRFFREHACAHVLNEGEPAALRAWLEAWLDGKVPQPSDAARRRAVQVFSPQENRRLLWQVIGNAAAAGNALRSSPERASTER